MARHEYRTDTLEVTHGASLTRHIEAMEEQGWEFVAVIPSSDGDRLTVLMRKPKKTELRAT